MKKEADEAVHQPTTGGGQKAFVLTEQDEQQAKTKGDDKQSTDDLKSKATPTDEMVATPGGYRPRSSVHLVEPGHVVKMVEGRLKKFGHAEKMIADLGAVEILKDSSKQGQPLMPSNVLMPEALNPPAFASGWICNTGRTNNSGHPITSFSTTWIVPPAPENRLWPNHLPL